MKKLYIILFIIALSSCLFADKNDVVSNKTSSLAKSFSADTPLGSVSVDGSVNGPNVIQNSDGSFTYQKPSYNYNLNMNPNLSSNYFKHNKTKYYKPNQTGYYTGNTRFVKPNKTSYYTGNDSYKGRKNNAVKPNETKYYSGDYKAHKQKSNGTYKTSKPNYQKSYSKTKYKKPNLKAKHVSSDIRPIIIGYGPSGLFAAVRFIEAGLKPIIIENKIKLSDNE